MQIDKITIYRERNFPSNPNDRFERTKLGIGFEFTATDLLNPQGFDSTSKQDMDTLREILAVELDRVQNVLTERVTEEQNSRGMNSPPQDSSDPF